MLLRQVLLVFIGLSAGGVIAAGVFAFLAMIGVFPRLIGKTATHRHILLYETVITLGGAAGNFIDLFVVRTIKNFQRIRTNSMVTDILLIHSNPRTLAKLASQKKASSVCINGF